MDSDASSGDVEELSSSGAGLGALAALTSAYTPKVSKRSERDTPKLEMTEGRRSKLRDIEVREWEGECLIVSGPRSLPMRSTIHPPTDPFIHPSLFARLSIAPFCSHVLLT